MAGAKVVLPSGCCRRRQECRVVECRNKKLQQLIYKKRKNQRKQQGRIERVKSIRDGDFQTNDRTQGQAQATRWDVL